jgi:hypothetical protein
MSACLVIAQAGKERTRIFRVLHEVHAMIVRRRWGVVDLEGPFFSLGWVSISEEGVEDMVESLVVRCGRFFTGWTVLSKSVLGAEADETIEGG